MSKLTKRNMKNPASDAEIKKNSCYVCGALQTHECHSLWLYGVERRICSTACRSTVVSDKTYAS